MTGKPARRTAVARRGRDTTRLFEMLGANPGALAELADPGFGSFELGGVAIDALLAAYLDADGRLVPAQIAELGTLDTLGLDEGTRTRRETRIRALDSMRAAAWADNTLVKYGQHVRAWRAWCRDEGVHALPLDPLLVAEHLVQYAFDWDDETRTFALDEDGGLRPSVAAGTVSQRLAALNKLAEFVGIPRPGDALGVAETLRGIRNRLTVAPRYAKAALDLVGLRRCLAATRGPDLLAARARAGLLLRARTGATVGQLASLRWADVTFGTDDVELELARTHRHGQPRTVAVAAHRDPDLCLVAALRHLREISAHLDAVFAHPDGKALSRQGLHQALTAITDWTALPELTDTELAALLGRAEATNPAVAARDTALLLTGFYAALRRSNLSALDWANVTDHGTDGLEVRLIRSKTDQEGAGRSVWVPQADPGSTATCPATALRAWRDTLTRALGHAPSPTDPVFARVGPGGAIQLDVKGRPTRLSGEGINDVVQRLTTAAGLDTGTGARHRFGGHSLRVGFCTEALRGDKLTIPEVAEVTGHKSIDVLVNYRREVNAPATNASRKLLGAVGT